MAISGLLGYQFYLLCWMKIHPINFIKLEFSRNPINRGHKPFLSIGSISVIKRTSSENRTWMVGCILYFTCHQFFGWHFAD